MGVDVGKLASEMGAAFLGTLKGKAPGIEEYAISEGKKMAQSIVTIEALYLAGTIGEDEAKLHLEIQKQASRAVLLTIEGLGLLAVEEAINAALDVVKEAVNSALGFVLVP